MQNTKKLLSISNLKKYFPIAKSSIFQKEQLYVKANEEISIDIYEGETFGLVGESGCGKSTLGRTVLQLYPQTAGSTLYYGRTLPQFAPSYIKYTLKNYRKMLAVYTKMAKKADECKRICEQAGESATFAQLQEMNLRVAEAQTYFENIAKVMGGFMTVKDNNTAVSLLLEKYAVDRRIALAERKEEKSGKSDPELDALRASSYDYARKIEAEKAKYASDPEFVRCEAYRDDGIDLSRLKYKEMRLLRKDLQVIFQDPYSSLNPRMTVGQIIEEGLVTHKFFKHGDPAMQEYILNVMRQCGLSDYMLHRYPHQFSGGQRQRICIARALAVNPRFVVCDECVSALDVSIQSQIINLLEELKEKQNLTYLFISHDLSVVRYISDRIGVMYLGNMVELGTAEKVFSDPRHPYTVALLSSIPTTDVNALKRERIILEGNIPSPIRPPKGCKFHTRCYMACEKCKRVPPPYVEVEPGHFVACHFLDKKVDEHGNYLFDLPGEKADGN